MNGFTVCDVWWNHQHETQLWKILWDFTFVTNLSLHHNQPDITSVLKDKQEVFLIDITVPGVCRSAQNSVEKCEKYMDLKIQIGNCWRSATSIAPIIAGALGSIPKDPCSLNKLCLPFKVIRTLQQSVLYSTAHILRRYLSV